MSNPPYDRRASPLDPEMMSPAERLAEAASLLARGILRHRLRMSTARETGHGCVLGNLRCSAALLVSPERSPLLVPLGRRLVELIKR
jgi:hypothetical protein